MGLFVFLLVGFVAGIVVRAVFAGRQGMGVVPTALFALCGSFIGGLVGGVFYGRRVFELHNSAIIVGIVIAFTVVFVFLVRARGRRGGTLF
jgi:uncharacterized membrane protein YeaQ/YmgE (transglycosylase-associated protein family)